MYVKPNAPRSIGGVLDDTIKLYRAAFRGCWGLALAESGCASVLMIWLALHAGPARVTPVRQLSDYMQTVTAPGTSLIYLLISILSLGFINAMYFQMDRYASSRPASFGEAVSAGFRLVPRSILLGLLFVLVGLGFGLVGGVAYAIGRGTYGAAAAVLIAIIVVVALYVIGRLFLATVILVLEDASAARSMSISWSLLKGNWWRAGTIYLVGIIILLVFYFLGAMFGGLAGALLGRGISSTLVGQVFAVAIATVVGPLKAAIPVSMYYDLKIRTEGTDLVGKVSALTAP